MKNKATSAAGTRGSVKRASAASKPAGTLKLAGKSSVPEDVQRNTYTRNRPRGLHVKPLGNGR